MNEGDDSMSSLFDKPFDYDEMVEDLIISCGQWAEELLEKKLEEKLGEKAQERMQEIDEIAQDLVLVKTIQNMREFGRTDNRIRTKLLEMYSAQQIDEAFAKADSNK